MIDGYLLLTDHSKLQMINGFKDFLKVIIFKWIQENQHIFFSILLVELIFKIPVGKKLIVLVVYWIIIFLIKCALTILWGCKRRRPWKDLLFIFLLSLIECFLNLQDFELMCWVCNIVPNNILKASPVLPVLHFYHSTCHITVVLSLL